MKRRRQSPASASAVMPGVLMQWRERLQECDDELQLEIATDPCVRAGMAS